MRAKTDKFGYVTAVRDPSIEDGVLARIEARLDAAKQRYLNAIETYAYCIAHPTFFGEEGIRRAAETMNYHRERVSVWMQRLAEYA